MNADARRCFCRHENAENARRERIVERVARWIVFILACVVLFLTLGCTSMAPMRGVFASLSDAEVGRIREQIGMDATAEMIREQRVDFTAEVKVPCAEMLRICSNGNAFKAALFVPLACTRFWIGADYDKLHYVTALWKTAIAYSCDLTPQVAIEHEREHLRGLTHF